MLIVLAMVAAFLRAASGRDRGARLVFFALAAWGLTVKESVAIPAALGTLGFAALAWERKRRARDVVFALACGALAALVATAVVVIVSGGWAELRTTLVLAREANAPDDYLRHYQTGGVLDYYARGLLLLQPVPWLLAFGFAALVLVRTRVLAASSDARSRRVLQALAVHLAVFSTVAFSYWSKNMRFLSPIYPAVAILAAAALAATHSAARSRGRRTGAVAAAALALAVMASSARDLRCFRHYFIEDEVQDLATPWFTQVDAQDRVERAGENGAAP